MPDHAPSGLTIRDALVSAASKGYDLQFVAEDGGVIETSDASVSVAAREVAVDVIWRIEGASDAADQLLVAAVVAPSGERGSLLLTYGPSASVVDDSVMQDLDIRSAEPGLPPEATAY